MYNRHMPYKILDVNPPAELKGQDRTDYLKNVEKQLNKVDGKVVAYVAYDHVVFAVDDDIMKVVRQGVTTRVKKAA